MSEEDIRPAPNFIREIVKSTWQRVRMAAEFARVSPPNRTVTFISGMPSPSASTSASLRSLTVSPICALTIRILQRRKSSMWTPSKRMSDGLDSTGLTVNTMLQITLIDFMSGPSNSSKMGMLMFAI
jgi:hypothetical protein